MIGPVAIDAHINCQATGGVGRRVDLRRILRWRARVSGSCAVSRRRWRLRSRHDGRQGQGGRAVFHELAPGNCPWCCHWLREKYGQGDFALASRHLRCQLPCDCTGSNRSHPCIAAQVRHAPEKRATPPYEMAAHVVESTRSSRRP